MQRGSHISKRIKGGGESLAHDWWPLMKADTLLQNLDFTSTPLCRGVSKKKHPPAPPQHRRCSCFYLNWRLTSRSISWSKFENPRGPQDPLRHHDNIWKAPVNPRLFFQLLIKSLLFLLRGPVPIRAARRDHSHRGVRCTSAHTGRGFGTQPLSKTNIGALQVFPLWKMS